MTPDQSFRFLATMEKSSKIKACYEGITGKYLGDYWSYQVKREEVAQFFRELTEAFDQWCVERLKKDGS